MTPEERSTLVAAMSDKTAMGRLNAGEIAACFDRLVEMGYDIVKRPVVEQKAPEPIVERQPEPPVEGPMLHTAKPDHSTAHQRQTPKPKGSGK
jgi:hypothetical protein